MMSPEVDRSRSKGEKSDFPEGFVEDGRMPVGDLYRAFDRLKEEFGWQRELVYTQKLETPRGELNFPIYCYRTIATGRSFWLFAGVHGEEPAGPNAISREIGYLGELGKEIPLVVFPLCNPKGYFRDWRYTNVYRDAKRGKSVGDTDWILPKPNSFPPRLRKTEPDCPEAEAIGSAIIKYSIDYPPVIFFDLHEDESLYSPYIYSHGRSGIKDPVALLVVKKLQQAGVPIIEHGETRYGEQILNGVVESNYDGSIDELMGAGHYFLDGEIKEKPYAVSGIVVETPTILVKNINLRIKAQAGIIRQFRRYWRIAEGNHNEIHQFEKKD